MRSLPAAAWAAQLPEPSADPEEVARIVEDVLADPVYDPLEPSLFDRLLEAAFEPILELLSNLTGTTPGTFVGYVILAAIVGVAAALLLRFARGTRRDPRVATGLDAASLGRSPGEWNAEAEQHEAAGNLRQAVRCRYRAVIAELAGVGLLDEVPGRTAGEYVTEVRDGVPPAAKPFSELTAAFERAWYSQTPLDAEDVALARDAGRRSVQAATGQRQRAEANS